MAMLRSNRSLCVVSALGLFVVLLAAGFVMAARAPAFGQNRARVPDLRGTWQGQIRGYIVQNVLVEPVFDPSGNPTLGKPHYFEDASDDQTFFIREQVGRVFAGWDAEGRKLTGVLMPDGTVSVQLFEPTENRTLFIGTLTAVGGQLRMEVYGHGFDDFGLTAPDPLNAGHFNMASGYGAFVKVN
jgi:hypothetical protein